MGNPNRQVFNPDTNGVDHGEGNDPRVSRRGFMSMMVGGAAAAGLAACGGETPQTAATVSPEASPESTPSATPTRIEPGEVPTDLPPTPTPTEIVEIDRTPLREWHVDESLFQGWEDCSPKEKVRRAKQFFDAHPTQATHPLEDDNTPLTKAMIEITHHLEVSAELFMDPSLPDGQRDLALKLLDVITMDTGYTEGDRLKYLDARGVFEEFWPLQRDICDRTPDASRIEWRFDTEIKRGSEGVYRFPTGGKQVFFATWGAELHEKNIGPTQLEAVRDGDVYTMGIAWDPETSTNRIITVGFGGMAEADFGDGRGPVKIEGIPAYEEFIKKPVNPAID